MSKTFFFYNCFVALNGEKTDIPFESLIDQIAIRNAREKFKSIRSGNISLLDMIQPNTNKHESRDRKIVVGKYRDNKPFLGNIGTDRIEEIPDDVIEITTALFIPSSYMAVIQYNHYGCRPRGLEQYFDSFLPVTPDETWGVIFEPIEADIGFSDLQRSTDIKKIEIKLDLSSRDRTINLKPEYQSVVSNIIEQTIDSHIDFGANTATIGFGNGRGRRTNRIDTKKLVELVSLLNLESDLFESVKVKYFSPSKKKDIEIDLKKEGILQRTLEELEQNAGWELIVNSIEEEFYTNGRPGYTNHRHHNEEMILAELPELTFNNNEA